MPENQHYSNSSICERLKMDKQANGRQKKIPDGRFEPFLLYTGFKSGTLTTELRKLLLCVGRSNLAYVSGPACRQLLFCGLLSAPVAGGHAQRAKKVMNLHDRDPPYVLCSMIFLPIPKGFRVSTSGSSRGCRRIPGTHFPKSSIHSKPIM